MTNLKKSKYLTPDMVLGTVEHIGCMDELVPRTSNSQLSLCVAKNDFTPKTKAEPTSVISVQLYIVLTKIQYNQDKKCFIQCMLFHNFFLRIVHHYLASQAIGVKSNLCLVLKIMFLVRISIMEGGCRGVAMANRASWGGIWPPSSNRLFCPCRNFRRP